MSKIEITDEQGASIAARIKRETANTSRHTPEQILDLLRCQLPITGRQFPGSLPPVTPAECELAVAEIAELRHTAAEIAALREACEAIVKTPWAHVVTEELKDKARAALKGAAKPANTGLNTP